MHSIHINHAHTIIFHNTISHSLSRGSTYLFQITFHTSFTTALEGSFFIQNHIKNTSKTLFKVLHRLVLISLDLRGLLSLGGLGNPLKISPKVPIHVLSITAGVGPGI